MSAELDALLIESLPDLNSAVQRMIDLETRIFRTIDQSAEDWAEENGWAGEFDYLSDKLWVAPPDWKMAGEDDDDSYLGYFSLELGAKDPAEWYLSTSDQWYLTRLLQVGEGRMGFRLETNAMGSGAWKKSLRGAISGGQIDLPVDEGGVFIPVRFDREAVIKALREDALKDALTPFKAALDGLLRIKKDLEPIIKGLRA